MAKALVNPRSVYTWDADALRYRSPSGRFVSQKAIKQALTTYVRRVQKEIERLAGEVVAGRIPVDEWQRLTANLVKSAHLANAAAARGGWAQMDARAFGKIGSDLKFQYTKLRAFAKEVAAGKLTADAIVDRAGMYARSASGAYERSRFDLHDDLAATGVAVQMRNVLGKGEHCKAGNGRPGCLEEAARGWVPLGELSLPGERRCLARCLCRVEYKTRKS